MWYRVVYIGGIGVFLEVLSQWHKRNIWFLHFRFFHFLLVIWTFFCSIFKCKFSFQISNGNFCFKFKKIKLSNFFISNFKNDFKNFYSIFCDIFQFFSFPFGVMAIVFNFQFKFQNRLFSKFSFPFGGRAKIFNSNFKNKKNHFKFSCGINEFFFSAWGCKIY
jgi:hypothetical protein